MFLQFPSGLAIYYLVSNLCQIGQQYFTNRTIGPPVPARARVEGARPAKASGSGKR
jgi:membrane protein insertase Oxa1/YidC/SpoIIIJ